MPDLLRRSLCVLPLLALPGPARAEPLALEALMARFAAIPERRARFREERRFAVLTQTLSSRGRLQYRRPDYLEMIKEWPINETTVVDGTRLIVTQPGGNDPPRIVDFASRPDIGVMFEAIRAPLAGDLGTLRRLFTIDAAGTAQAWTLTLAPSDKRAAELVRAVRLAGRSDWIDEIRIVQANGDESWMQIDPA